MEQRQYSPRYLEKLRYLEKMKKQNPQKYEEYVARNKEFTRKHRNRNRDKRRAQGREYYQRHKNDPTSSWNDPIKKEQKSQKLKARRLIDAEFRKRERSGRCRYMKSRNAQLKEEFLNVYGGKCNCCGEEIPKFLTLDHVQNDGCEERAKAGTRQFHAYLSATKNYDPDRYQILCYNCNLGKAHNHGVCPHRDVIDKSESELVEEKPPTEVGASTLGGSAT